MQKADRIATDQPFIEESVILVFQDLGEEGNVSSLCISYMYLRKSYATPHL